jgi:hypothetical protein
LGCAWSRTSQTLPEFIAYARANPGKLSYGSSGVGSATHLFGEMFKAATGADITHVPYRGQGPALTDLIGGQLQLMFPIAPDVIGQVRANTVRPLALAATSGSAVLPGVPLMPALGHPDLVASAWTALYVPAKTPSEVIERLRKEVAALMTSTAFVERMNGVGIEIRPMQSAEFQKIHQQRTRALGKDNCSAEGEDRLALLAGAFGHADHARLRHAALLRYPQRHVEPAVAFAARDIEHGANAQPGAFLEQRRAVMAHPQHVVVAGLLGQSGFRGR